MKTNEEILDEFGRILISSVYEFNYSLLLENIGNNLEYENVKQKARLVTKNSLESMLFDFLKIFEENEQFKLIYEEDGKQVDLNKISEMLKAEPTIENGWIARFSKYAKDEDFQ